MFSWLNLKKSELKENRILRPFTLKYDREHIKGPYTVLTQDSWYRTVSRCML